MKSAKRTARKKGGGRKSTPGTFTPEKRTEFLELYAQGGTVRQHAKKVGVSTTTVFHYVREDQEFAQGYRLAQELNTDTLEDKLHAHAMDGNITALFGMLRARRPGTWRENQNVKEAAGEFAAAFSSAMRELTSGSKPGGGADAGTTVSRPH